MMEKNVAQSTFQEFSFEEGFHLLEFKNESHTSVEFKRDIDSTFIQLHFCVKGGAKFLFNNNSYSLDVLDGRLLFLQSSEKTAH